MMRNLSRCKRNVFDPDQNYSKVPTDPIQAFLLTTLEGEKIFEHFLKTSSRHEIRLFTCYFSENVGKIKLL